MINQSELSNPKNPVIVIRDTGVCRLCDIPYDIHLTDMEAKEHGWLAKGSGKSFSDFLLTLRIPVIRQCHSCGALYLAIRRTIPIISAPFPCPNCGKKDIFNYSVRKIREREETFEFEVEIECRECKKKMSLKKIVHNFLSVVKLEVGPTGISIKNA